MPNAFTQFLSSADADARRLLGVPGTFSSRGKVYGSASVIMAPAESDLLFAAGGAEVRVKATATVRKSVLDKAPAEGDALSLPTGKFYIVAVSSTDADPLLHLTLAS